MKQPSALEIKFVDNLFDKEALSNVKSWVGTY